MKTFRDVAITAAHEAGKVHMRYFNAPMTISTKTASFDRVTAADLEAERVVTTIIRQEFPDHNILAEEQSYPATASPYTWVIDPLDGTNNFSHTFPIFAVSIGLALQGEVILGVIFDPTRNELFIAEKGKGSFLNDTRLCVSPAQQLSEAILITGFYYDRGAAMRENLDKIRQFLEKKIIGIRRLGAASLDLCNVASGRASGYWEFQLSPWDFAAGMLIVTEAGGMVTDRAGGKLSLQKSFVIASNGHIHQALREILM